MKYPYLFFFALLVFSSCEKWTIDDSTIEIMVEQPEIEAFRDYPIIYLHGWYGPRQLGKTYVERLEEELDHGKLEVTTSDPDYVLVMKDLYVTEETWKDRNRDFSELHTNASFTLIDKKSGVIVRAFRLSTSNPDFIDDSGSFTSSGGVGKSFKLHAKETRKKVKEILREIQD